MATRTSSKCPYPNASPAGGCITVRAKCSSKSRGEDLYQFPFECCIAAAKVLRSLFELQLAIKCRVHREERACN